MVKFINRLTGGDMWVHESRAEEYVAAGHKPAAPPKPKKPLRRDGGRSSGTAEEDEELPPPGTAEEDGGLPQSLRDSSLGEGA